MPFLSPNQQHQSTEENDSVLDWGQHAAITGQEPNNVSVGCLALWLQGNVPSCDNNSAYNW